MKGGSKSSESRAVSLPICLRGSALGTEQPLQMPKVKSITRAWAEIRQRHVNHSSPEIKRQPGASKMQRSCQLPTSAEGRAVLAWEGSQTPGPSWKRRRNLSPELLSPS